MPSYANPDGSFFNRSAGNVVRTVVPASGDTVAMHPADGDLYANHAATIAALTIKLPPPAYNGHKVEIVTSHIVTALTLLDHLGGAITGAPTAATAGGRIIMRRVGGVWLHWS